jgi:predicted RNA-binding Zn ribbon-like protein
VVDRPLTGEPFALDLLNTEWMEHGRRRDALDEPGWTHGWLAEHGIDTGTAEVDTPLRQVRAVLRAVLEQPGEAAESRLNAVLARGSVRLIVQDGRPGRVIDVDDDWRPAWLAAEDLRRLFGEHPDRIHHCANPACSLHFLDTSRNGTRRWCSMQG